MTVRFIGGPYDGQTACVDYENPRTLEVPVDISGCYGKIEYAIDALHFQTIVYHNSPRHYRFVRWVTEDA